MSKQLNVALIGNPNTGKTSVFNQLTGLKQQVGNYPGITVEKKEGICKLPRGVKAHILDLPGTYSLNASSLDENVVIELLLNKNDKDYVMSLIESIRNGVKLTKDNMMTANNLWKQYQGSRMNDWHQTEDNYTTPSSRRDNG